MFSRKLRTLAKEWNLRMPGHISNHGHKEAKFGVKKGR